MVEPILETRNLTKRYGDFQANKDVCIRTFPRTIHGILGPNGAGKTTLFNCLAGTIRLSSGSILLEGRDISRSPQHVRPSLGIGRSFQVTNLFPDLSIHENLRLAGQALSPLKGFMFWHAVNEGDASGRYADHVLDRIGLSGRRNVPASELSHGNQRLLEVGMALMAKPKILLLDEPTSGMGIDDVPKMIRLLKEVREDCTVILIEHNVGLVTEVCDEVTVMQAGQVISHGTPAEVSADDRVVAAYLGEEI